MACAAIGWGVASTLMVRLSVASCAVPAANFAQSTAFNFEGLVVCRLLIGVFEAGFGPAIPLYFCEGFSLSFASSLPLNIPD